MFCWQWLRVAFTKSFVLRIIVADKAACDGCGHVETPEHTFYVTGLDTVCVVQEANRSLLALAHVDDWPFSEQTILE